MIIEAIKKDLNNLSKKSDVNLLQSFFKTEKGQYAEGDIFIGVRVPQQREVVKKYFKTISFREVAQFISSPIHEYRFSALLVLIFKFENSKTEKEKEIIYNFYLKNIKYVNNWDLVDLSAPKILGAYTFNHRENLKILFKLAKSKNLWSRRIAIISTFYFIKRGEYKQSFQLAEILLDDDQDLIHKAVGWMLREVGNNLGQKIEEEFLNKYYQIMPRTMLRYAIEKFTPSKRKLYLNKKTLI